MINKMTHGKGCNNRLLKIAFAETMYAIWTTRNMIIFRNKKDDCLQNKDIIDKVLCRAEIRKKQLYFIIEFEVILFCPLTSFVTILYLFTISNDIA